MTQPFRGHAVLFLCHDNAVLSPMAAALLNHWGRGRFRAWSAGWTAAPGMHVLTSRVLRRAQLPSAVKPRSWTELGAPDAPTFEFLVLLGRDFPDSVAPAFKGDPILARWQVDDPSQAVGTPEAQERAFERALREIEARVKLFASLRFDEADRPATERRLAEIEISTAVP